jgi:ribonuclease-3
MVADISDFERQANVSFHDKALIQRAFIHRSYVNESGDESDLLDNERLEFLGDAVLTYVVSEDLYRRYPDLNEGPLTSIRSALVRREMLARLAMRLQMGDYLLLGHGEEESGGRQRPATLCAVFEAVVGAIYMDQGITGVHNFVLPMMRDELERVEQDALNKDPKSRLQEYVQSTKGVTPKYRTLESTGPDHAKTFVMRVNVADQMIGVGAGRSKGEATQQAASMALNRLGQYAPEYVPNPELETRFGFTTNSDDSGQEPTNSDG